MLRALQKSNKYQFHSLWFDPTRFEPTIYRTWGEHANHYATDAVARNEYHATAFNLY
jgi:hypothetical protein